MGLSTPRPDLVAASGDDGFFKGPKYLKVLLEPAFMDFGNDAMVFKGARAFAKETGASIMMSKKGDWYPHNGKSMKVVAISGEEGNVLAALSQLMSRWPERGSIIFLVPRSAKGELIGSGGEEINKIAEKTSAGIHVKEIRTMSEAQVIVKGAKEEVEEVAAWLLTKLANFEKDVRDNLSGPYQSSELDSYTEIYCKFTHEQMARVIGKGGKNINSVRHNWPVRVTANSEQNLLMISGTIGDIHAAHAYIVRNFVINPQQDSA